MAAAEERRLHADEAKGCVEQAAGAPTRDDDRRREGSADRDPSAVKGNIDRVADKVKGLLRSEN